MISPGSRNAPLSISLHRHPEIETYVIPDERAASFFALGMAQQRRQPVLICCTSGSAVLNYAPAIAEAYYQRIPLFVVTADRPEEWIDQGDGQTIRQKEVFANYIRHSAGLIQDAVLAPDRQQNRTRIQRAIEMCRLPVDGPVHLNVPLREPLYQTKTYAQDEVPVVAQQLSRERPKPWHNPAMSATLGTARRILILTALMEPNPALERELGAWAENEQVAVLTESTSNLKDPRFFGCIDRLIFTFSPDDLDRFQPDLLITVGHQIISKRIKAILRERKPKHHWHIDPDTRHPDTFQALSRRIHDEPAAALKKLRADLSEVESSYASWLRERESAIEQAHAAYLDTCAFSDLKAVDVLLENLPENWNLQLGNSASVRYVQLFQEGRGAKCHCNRGTSGIDGCTSTAMGAAASTGEPTLLLTGDMAFFYDSNAFWHPHRPENLKIVVLNNGGGGIFRIIDGPGEEAITEKYFEAHHTMSAEKLAGMFELPYRAAKDEASLTAGLADLFSEAPNSPVILEVFTPRRQNDRVLKAYFKFLQGVRQSAKAAGHV